MSNQNITGATVRKLRVGMELTQDAFAARCQLQGWDLSRETLAKIEGGVRRVNDAEVYMLARVIGCPVGELFKVKKADVLPKLRHGRP